MFRSQDESITHVLLNGGLGNQLFEVAAGLATSPTHRITCNYSFGHPRLNKRGFPQITCFAIPPQIRIDEAQKENIYLRRLLNFELRSGISQNMTFSKKLISKLFRIITRMTLVLQYRTPISISVGDDVGFSPLKIGKRSTLLIGYFQSYRWMSIPRVNELMQSLRPNKTPEIERYAQEAEVDKPLILHFRLTDYLQEVEFGSLSETYYRNALRELDFDKSKNWIWAFSDDVELAQKLFPFLQEYKVKWIGDIGNCPVHTLEVMRMGSNYILCNSTFGWWAASLCFDKSARIIAPAPWFKGKPTPKDLLPPSWIVVESQWF